MTTSTSGEPWKTAWVLDEVSGERFSQDQKWGQQNHPDGTGQPWYETKAEYARLDADSAADGGCLTWGLILREEFYEAMAESDPIRLREELIQVAAVAVAWVEAIDRRSDES